MGTPIQQLLDLSGRVAYLPGGYGDIGRALAWGLARAGARVAVSGRDAGKAQAFAATLQAAGHDALGLAMDAHDVASIRRSVDAVAGHFGHLDVLVNCVGMQREQKLMEGDAAASRLSRHLIEKARAEIAAANPAKPAGWIDDLIDGAAVALGAMCGTRGPKDSN